MSGKISPSRNRRFNLPSNPWIPYVGDCKALDTFLGSKGNSWIIPKFFNALFRGISQVLFVNNPLSGLLILVALYWSDLTVGLATTAAATTAIITSLLMRQDLSSIRAGLTTYNAVLVGCVTASLWFPIYGEHLTPKLWAFIIAGASLSVFVTSALANILSSYKFSLPCLTLPFNVVTILLFICLMPPVLTPPQTPNTTTGIQNVSALIEALQKLNLTELNRQTRQVVEKVEDGDLLPTTTLPPGIEEIEKPVEKVEKAEKKEESLDWGKVFAGIIISMGQVFAVENLLGSILIYVAVMIYSPLLCLMCLLGATLSTFAGLIFTPGPVYTTIYAGIWGYNGILSAGAVGGFFIVLTCHSFITAIANVLFTVLLQHALVIIFTSARLPVFTLPFVLSTLLFLSVSSSGDQLPRIKNISFPEMHRYEYMENLRVRKLNQRQIEQIEEKELVLKDVQVVTDDKETEVADTNGQEK